MHITKLNNTDSFKFIIKRFYNLNTGKHWILINLIFFTLIFE